MENLFLTSLTTPEVRELFRKELETYFGNQSISTPPKNEPPITTKQLCEFLGITEPTVIRWRKKGKIPFMQIGSSIRFDVAAVLASLEVKNKKKGLTK
ncbi:helix-turn-helix domain-containing protein [Pedobacter sp. ASV1-7]|uniref:helix-turn-helix domain-containing protein n=1 Tax=Pedobacter sp. ASV1-7 TaxID=3145237 RepID=UPI0032E86FFE